MSKGGRGTRATQGLGLMLKAGSPGDQSHEDLQFRSQSPSAGDAHHPHPPEASRNNRVLGSGFLLLYVATKTVSHGCFSAFVNK